MIEYKEDFLARLQKGESVDSIANKLTNALNEANKEYEEYLEIQKKSENKRNSVAAFVDSFANLFDAYGAKDETIKAIRDSDVDALVAELEELVSLVEVYGKTLLEDDKAVWGSASRYAKSKDVDPIEEFLNNHVR